MQLGDKLALGPISLELGCLCKEELVLDPGRAAAGIAPSLEVQGQVHQAGNQVTRKETRLLVAAVLV